MQKDAANARGMRRVLFLSYYTPPRPGVATNRTSQLLRYLPAHGWNATAVTPVLPGAGANVVQTPYTDIVQVMKRAAGLGNSSTHAVFGTEPAAHGNRQNLRQRAILFVNAIAKYPDAQIGWLFHARRVLRDLLATGNYDAVLSSSPPFTTNLILAGLGLTVPWVADFRDLWGDARKGTGLYGFLDKRLERWTLGKAQALTTISEPMARTLQRRRPGVPVHVVANAFDPKEWTGVPFAIEDRCTLVYAGQLFGGRRDPRPLFRAVRSLIEAGEIDREELHIDFYSQPEPWLDDAICENNLEGIVRVPGVVSREEVMAAERRADRLLVLLWDEGNSEGVVTGKLFEYLGARRRVLTVGGPVHSAVDEILDVTKGGVRPRDERALAAEVRSAVEEHKAARVPILDERAIEPYTAGTMAAKFAQILDSVTEPAAQPVPERSLQPEHS
jgi:glycosyltransferase involved in cell wall biosynthesis